MRRLICFVCLAIGLAPVACKRSDETVTTQPPAVSAPSAPAAVARVTAIDLGNQIGADGRIASASAKTTFAPTDTIYASVATDHASATTVSARWTYENGQLVSENHQTVAASNHAATEFHIAKPDGWPTGRYKVEIALNGQPAGTREFEVR